MRPYGNQQQLVEGLLLSELVNPRVCTTMGDEEVAFISEGFRPIKKRNIEVFQEMCRKASVGELLDPDGWVLKDAEATKTKQG
jgi:hypothetical protein